MEVLKTILKWLLPSGKFAYKMLAASAEVFWRHSFGRRYAPVLVASFLCSFLFLNFARGVVPQLRPALIDYYLLIYFILVLYHLAQMWRRRSTIHSYSCGQSWEFWSRYNLNPNLVKIIIEPLFSVLVGMLLMPANSLVSLWLQLGGFCLFAKGLLSYRQLGNRVQDSIDARLEGERIGTGVRQQTTPQGDREQRVNPVVEAEPAQPTPNSLPQIYSRLDPALQQLVATQNQNHPNPPAANPQARPLVLIRRQRRMPGTGPGIVPNPQPAILQRQAANVAPRTPRPKSIPR